MLSKPLLNINNPQPIKPGGAYWLVGLEPQTIGNRNQLRQNWQVNFELNIDSHAGLANLAIIRDVCSKTEGLNDVFYAIGNQYISRHNALTPSSVAMGNIIHTIDDDGSNNYCAYPGLINTETGNMLYTSEKNLNIAYYGFHNGSTETTKIIDSAGRDLSSLNGKVVRNLQDNSTATITSVSTTNATNDTLNFSGGFSAGDGIGDGHEWVVFVDKYKTLDTDKKYPQFGGQDSYIYWSRQIVNLGGDYFIGHGNYLAKLSNDETTFDEDFTKLTSFMQFNCMDIVGSNILIGGETLGKGSLLLWDGVTPNKYSSIINTINPVYSVKEYRGGAIILSGAALYWTDGYSVKHLSNMPGVDVDYKITAGHSSMLIEGNNVFINCGIGGYTQSKKGIWIYDILNNSWTFSPYESAVGKKLMYGDTAGGVFLVNRTGYNGLLVSYQYDSVHNTIASIYRHGTNDFSIAIFSYTAPKFTTIHYAELILGQTMATVAATVPSAIITMAISDGKKPFWMYGQVKTTASNENEIPIDGSQTSYNRATIGDLIMMLDGICAGEYAFISSIANAGTANEVWTLDRDLTAKVEENDDIQIISCHKLGEHTISDYVTQPLMFADGCIVNGDFYVIIIIKNTAGNLDIRDISLF